VRARAQVVGQPLRGGAQVGAGRKPNEADHQPVLVQNADLEIAVGDDGREEVPVGVGWPPVGVRDPAAGLLDGGVPGRRERHDRERRVAVIRVAVRAR
jgi:hypothetical protein